MTTWILILVLVAPSVSGGSSIEHVPGFTSQESCQAAALKWLDNVPKTWSKPYAMCVQP